MNKKLYAIIVMLSCLSGSIAVSSDSLSGSSNSGIGLRRIDRERSLGLGNAHDAGDLDISKRRVIQAYIRPLVPLTREQSGLDTPLIELFEFDHIPDAVNAQSHIAPFVCSGNYQPVRQGLEESISSVESQKLNDQQQDVMRHEVHQTGNKDIDFFTYCVCTCCALDRSILAQAGL